MKAHAYSRRLYVIEYWNVAQARWLPWRGEFATVKEAERAAKKCLAKTRINGMADSAWEWIPSKGATP